MDQLKVNIFEMTALLLLVLFQNISNKSRLFWRLLLIIYLNLHLSKCKFFKKKAKVLGHIVTQNDIFIDPAKIKVIVNWPQPMDGKAMQHFLGAANFHQDYASTIATIAAPLNSCCNDIFINWTL